jgi:hypothetical protein
MRELGLSPANGGTTRTIRRRAAFLGLDTSHFRSDGFKRVQVKTSICDTKAGWHQAGRRPYSIGNSALLVPYDPEVIDLFFVVDGDLSIYVIPSRAVGGRTGILLRSYKNYIVGNAAGLMPPKPRAAFAAAARPAAGHA